MYFTLTSLSDPLAQIAFAVLFGYLIYVAITSYKTKPMHYKFTLKPKGAPADQEPVTFLSNSESQARFNFNLLRDSARVEKDTEIAILDPKGNMIEHAVLKPRS